MIFWSRDGDCAEDFLHRDRSESIASVDFDSPGKAAATMASRTTARSDNLRSTPNTDPVLRRLRSGSEALGINSLGAATLIGRADEGLGRHGMTSLRTRSVSFAESVQPAVHRTSSSSQAHSSPVASDNHFSVSSLLTLPLRITEYFALSSGESKVGDGSDDMGRGVAGGVSVRMSELSALSAFERLLICAQSFSSEHYKNQSAVADWVHFQSVLLEECLAEASSLLVLNAESRTLKSFYGASQEVAGIRRHRIADLFRFESLRVFRLPSTVINSLKIF